MAQYEVSAKGLYQAGDDFADAAGQMEAAGERLASVLSGLDECLTEFRKPLIRERDAVRDLSGMSREMGRTLHEIAQVYTQAERSVFEAGSGGIESAAAPPKTPIIRKNPALLLFGDLVIPDWLQLAVLRYEQAQLK